MHSYLAFWRLFFRSSAAGERPEGGRGKTAPLLASTPEASSIAPEVVFSFVKQSLHPFCIPSNRCCYDQQNARDHFVTKKSSVRLVTHLSDGVDQAARPSMGRCSCRPSNFTLALCSRAVSSSSQVMTADSKEMLDKSKDFS